ncbi:MAG: permease, partial [Anaerolineales bacterium]|nr:permease [Anaerolineales bacterium]
AWIIVILIPGLVIVFFQIHFHYKALARRLSLDEFGAPARVRRNRVVLPIGGVHRGTLHALNYARSLSPDVTAVHVALDQAEEDKVQGRWETWGDGVRLVIIPSPYRALIEPLVQYIRSVAEQRQPGDILTVVVPEFLPERPWQNLLHMQTVFFLRMGLLGVPDIVIIDVPYHSRSA